MSISMYNIIEKKTNKETLTSEELEYFVNGFCDGSIPDYQASALIMAIFLNGMGDQEITDLTLSMLRSGEHMDLSAIPGIKVDKHSTGGIGDTTTLVLTSLVAACGGKVAKMSGRGLGVATGTVDKLESIPGFRTALSAEEFINNVNKIGISLVGQTKNIAPADKKMYAIRDVTATAKSIPLIASSIMSKKLAAGADKFVLDVKIGTGALVEKYDDGVKLAKLMCKIGELSGHETVCYITNMNRPLGTNVGHLLEVQEAVETLKGNGAEDVNELCLQLAAEMLSLAEIDTYENCKQKARMALKNGEALEKFKQLVKLQGGMFEAIENPELYYPKSCVYSVKAPQSGFINFKCAEDVGRATAVLGAARKTKDALIDFKAGLAFNKRYSEYIKAGEELCRLYSADDTHMKEAEQLLLNTLEFKKEAFEPEPLVFKVVR